MWRHTTRPMSQNAFKHILENIPVNPKELIVKCYSEQDGVCWVAVCLDFNLAAQGDSFEEVKIKLEAMITEYV